jgi:EAL domain-containing protein (putative c-di-GMP-specific phosphodiesterase class I)
MKTLDNSPLRAVVIIGDEIDRARAVSLCCQLGIALEGWTASGRTGVSLIRSLAVAPDLVVADLRAPDMDGADLIRELSTLKHHVRLIIASGDCPRVQDTALMLAAALDLQGAAAVSGALSAASLRTAIDESLASVARLAPVPPVRADRLRATPPPDGIDIRGGLLRDEFELYYQPKINLSDCKVRGYEALIRWRHPRHGLLTPAHFLAQAEDAGLIELLTMKVLRMALENSQSLRSAGVQLPIAVNLSPLSLTNADLADQIADAMRRSGLPPAAIAFEVTEHSEIADLGVALRVLLKLRLQGHRLSLDDYGAGHASILQLSRIPFSELKMDGRLVHNAWKRPHLQPLLRQAIESARLLGVTSVAEGIETQQDWDFVRALGCEQGQGYLIARPMPVSALASWRPNAAALAGCPALARAAA